MAKEHELLLHIERQLLAQPMPESEAKLLDPDWIPDVPFNDPPVSAAVLIALVTRQAGLSVVFTLRSSGLRAHSGQIAFPGGKLDPTDVSPGSGAIREAEEEIALKPKSAKILGYMPSYMTGTNYLITPVVAQVSGDQNFVPNPVEVDEIFEVPLTYMRAQNSFSRLSLSRNERTYSTWQLIYGPHTIWGITANLAHSFCEIALSGFQE